MHRRVRTTMETCQGLIRTSLGCLAILAAVCARGPVCLHGTGVISPDSLTNVTECWPWESCFSEHYTDRDGNQGYNFGCRVTAQCGVVDHGIPGEIVLCEKCCSGDICNTDICKFGTVPPKGLPCLTCVNTPTIPSCNQVTHCRDGEVCFAEKLGTGPVPTFNIGCLRKDVCAFFEQTVQIVGKRGSGQDSEAQCHECCQSPGCNRDACSDTVQVSGTTVAGPTSGTSLSTQSATTPTIAPARDCWELKDVYNITSDGEYNVTSSSGRLTAVRCDMTTDGGGWIIFQKRLEGKVNFNRLWDAYKNGFGTLADHGEFWIGLDLLREFTKDHKQKLRVDLCDWAARNFYAEYNTFAVGPESDNYRLSVVDYHGDAFDALITGSGGSQTHNNMMFSTPEADHDTSGHNCARDYNGGWWFGSCISANLNGIYQHQQHPASRHQGLIWRPIEDNLSFKGTEMKFRPSHVPSTGAHFSCPVQ